MNAQEAIKIIDKTDPDLLTEEYCEALSIVLESAKTLQEIRDRALSYAFIKDIDCTNVELYEFAKWVFDKAEGFEVEK